MLVLAGAPALRIGTPQHFIEPGFAVQGRLSWLDTLDGAGQASLELKRLRFSLKGSVDDGQLTFGVQFNTTPAALELLDLWLGWTPTRGVTLKAGQLKTPFTRHRAGSFQTLPLTDWSVASVHFGAERQVGALVELSRGPAFSAFGVFTGPNARAAFARGLADLYGVRLTNPSDLRVKASPEPIHPELVARTGAAFTDGPVRTAAFFSAAWDLRPTWGVDFQLRLAPELKLEWGTLSLEWVGYAGWARDAEGTLIAASRGATAEATWQLHPRWMLAARWSAVELLAAARLDAQARATDLLPLAPAADRPLLEAAGLTPATREVALGLTVSPLTALRVQVEAAWLHARSDELRFRLQLQLAL